MVGGAHIYTSTHTQEKLAALARRRGASDWYKERFGVQQCKKAAKNRRTSGSLGVMQASVPYPRIGAFEVWAFLPGIVGSPLLVHSKLISGKFPQVRACVRACTRACLRVRERTFEGEGSGTKWRDSD